MHQLPAHSWVEVSEQALLHNIRAHRRLIRPRVKLMAVVKSNAYGHGLDLVARVAEKSREVDWLGVASLSEAIALRRSDIYLPILILSYFRPFIKEDIKFAIKNHISFVVYELEQIRVLEKIARQVGKPALVHLKLETGMARLGLFPKEAKWFLNRILKSPHLKLEGIASHFATAEAKTQTFLNKQLANYKNFINSVSTKLPPNILQHIACSAAITAAPQSHFGLVRLGIALYGLWPSLENRQMVQKKYPNFKLMPALTWKTQVVEVQKLKTGTPVGYGCTYITKKPTVMAAIPVGYWEGYDRKLSNRGTALIHGQHCPIIGRICMNISMADVTRVKNVRVGDEVVLIGRQGKLEVTADDLARKVGTISYEIVTRINSLLLRLLL
ncbi:MAG: alanine racemase [Patescibacteria group bacterium]